MGFELEILFCTKGNLSCKLKQVGIRMEISI